MRFTLTYDGLLQPSGSAADKMRIRQAMHKQLAVLWQTEPLSDSAKLMQPGGAHLTTIGGHDFTAVIHDYLKLRAELDILLLRAAPAGNIIVSADIDNQLKTLFDGLCWPSVQQIPAGWSPGADQRPLHCLLQDDRFITRVNVETDRWYAEPNPNHVRLFIRVSTWAVRQTWGSIGFA